MFGDYIKEKRIALQQTDKAYSLRQFAVKLGVSASYLSQIESNQETRLSEELIVRIAKELNEDEIVLLAMNNKIASRLKDIILKRPLLFSNLIHSLENMPDDAIVRIAREVQDGDW